MATVVTERPIRGGPGIHHNVGDLRGVKVYLHRATAAQEERLTSLREENDRLRAENRQNFDAEMRQLEIQASRAMERLRFEFDIVRTALAEGQTEEERADKLRFFSEIGLLSQLDQEKLAEWANEKVVPELAAAPSGRENVAPLKTKDEYVALYGDDAYGPDTTEEIPTVDDITAVLESVGDGCTVPLTRMELPYPMALDWRRSVTVTHMAAHAVAAPYFRDAFRGIYLAGMESHARLYGGLYSVRLTPGSKTLSPHAWGIAVSLNPDHNKLAWGPDRMTMHPVIVSIMKRAGFAWMGDTGFGGGTFVLSRTSLQEIKESGYTPVC